MTTFTVSITDPAHLAGITAARNQHNADLAEGEPTIDTDEAYVQFVMASAAESYAKQYGDAP